MLRYEVKLSTLKSKGINIPDAWALINGLQSTYPEHPWEPWRWDNLPNEFWKDLGNQKKYLKWLGDYVGVQSVNDWYFLRDTDILNKICICNTYSYFYF